MVNYALKKAGGAPFWDNTGTGYYYWTSSEFSTLATDPTNWSEHAFTITANGDNHVFIYAQPKQMDNTGLASNLRVRAFVAF